MAEAEADVAEAEADVAEAEAEADNDAETVAATDPAMAETKAADAADAEAETEAVAATEAETPSNETEEGTRADSPDPADGTDTPESPEAADGAEQDAATATDETAAEPETEAAAAEAQSNADDKAAAPASEADAETGAGDSEDRDPEDHPLHGIAAAAPVTGALPESVEDQVSDTPGTEDTGMVPAAVPATGAVPAADTRRSRRLAESQAAGATAVRKNTAGTAAGTSGSGTAAGSPVPGGAASTGTTGRNTRLALILGGIVLAAAIAILLFVFVFNDKGEGVIEENVSPVDLEAGACLRDWEDVNSRADVVSCETPHDAQLVATEDLPEGDAFPGTAALEDRVNEVCEAVEYADAAQGYPDLKLTKSIPTEQTWSNGDRRVDCFVFTPEGQQLTESLLP